MKKIIYTFGIVFLTIVIVLNVIFTAKMNLSEHITIKWNNIIYIIGILIVTLTLFIITNAINKKIYKEESKKKVGKILLIISLAIYVLFSIGWVIMVKPGIGGDQVHVGNIAQTFYRGNDEEFLPNLTYAGIPLIDYMQAYTQQIPLSFVFSIFFRIIKFDVLESLRFLNIICNFLTIFALYKISQILSNKYKTNKVLLFTLILTFITLPMLATFIYGDIPAITSCLFAVYFAMLYEQTKNCKHLLISAIFTMLAFMFRMNSLIFIIATVIYLTLNTFRSISWKERLIKIALIAIYIIISIVPSVVVKEYYINKYNLDKNKAMPTINYIYMAMEEGPRANGWYSEQIGEYALKNPEKAKEEYKDKIKERLTYFKNNIGYTMDFYIMKITSMWAENTYSTMNNNGIDESKNAPLEFYQKALLIITCLCSLIVLIQNRKNISLEVLFLITIFIGGFAFHIIWEAKSRYIIPYIVVLIPIASICINSFNIDKLKKHFIKCH